MRKMFAVSVVLCLLGTVCLFSAAWAEDASAAPAATPWKGEASLGYTKSSGNTNNAQLATSAKAERATEKNTWTLKAGTFYSSTNKKMDAQKYYGGLRYSFNFGKEKRWYNFYGVEAEHDRFANIDHRVIASTGPGYWFSRTDDFKAQAELGLGVQYTNYRNGNKSETEPVLVPHAYLEKRVFEKARLSEDITLYPSLRNSGEYRMRSETAFTNPLSDAVSLRLSYLIDYSSDPAAGKKKTDTRLVAALVYAF